MLAPRASVSLRPACCAVHSQLSDPKSCCSALALGLLPRPSVPVCPSRSGSVCSYTGAPSHPPRELIYILGNFLLTLQGISPLLPRKVASPHCVLLCQVSLSSWLLILKTRTITAVASVAFWLALATLS